LSDVYVDNSFKLKVECSYGYVWETKPNVIKNGSWCPKCANKVKSIDDEISLAPLKNGYCLSKQYNNSVEKMTWKCSDGHIWNASFNQIQSGNWCPTCCSLNRNKDKKLAIDVYKEIAVNKGGICLMLLIHIMTNYCGNVTGDIFLKQEQI